MGKIIAVTSQKGGVGKTTTVVNLGASLAILGKKTLLVDTDPQGSIVANFQIDDYEVQNGIFDVIVNKVLMTDAIINLGIENLEIVPSNVRNEKQEVDLFTHGLQKHILKSILATIKEDYDYILLDCPPSLGTMTLNALAAADSIIIPVQPEYFAIRALGRFIKTIRRFGQESNPKLKLEGILITLYDKRLKQSKEIHQELKNGFQDFLFDTIIPRNSKLSEAPSYGKPAAFFDVSSPGSVGYLKLAEEIIQ
ncbi:MAG: AAA family ATPase [Caldithrix sp.]|nr:AAA family ATPase [Caldithrix sp.]